MPYTRAFKELNKKFVAEAGGKGASLGEMLQAGIPVPDGFVVLSEAFEHFLTETDLNIEIDAILQKVDHAVIHTVENASEKIRALILQAKMPADIEAEISKDFSGLGADFVAVRSSATSEDSAAAAWAGQLDSFLNTTQTTLLENVQKCWASLFTPRAIFYRFEKGLHGTNISVAVVVQKMIQSEVSGIAFSVHPVTQDYDQLIIEAGFGLGEAIVSGSITPDSFVVEKSNWNILDKNINTQDRGLFRKKDGGNEWQDIPTTKGEQPTLSDGQVVELAKLIVKIEQHYGFPVDVEWAREGGKFYIVQSRPITTLTNQPQQTFTKAYTRNFSIIMQQAWFAANKENLIPKLGLEEYPYNPPYLYFMQEGVEEVWENTKSNRWLLDKLVEKFKSDHEFFPILYKRYFDRLAEIETWWKKDIKTIEELETFITKVYEGVSDFVVIYGALMDERVPQDIKDLAEKFREKDAFFAECNIAIGKALRNIYPELGYLVVYITREELGKNIDEEELKRRDKGFALIPGIYQGTISFDELVRKFPDYRFVIEKGEQDEHGLKGQSAYRGKVTGRVRIVKRTDQAEKVTEGDIIVAPMTTPDFVPAMKKAAGFVTDEGGVTCHAAIIAREMKKPCIIGTKTATQVLKDGDMVEVDADNGIVKILQEQQKPVLEPIILSKIFSREKTLFYFSMWNDSDRRGWKNFLGHDVKCNLFIIPPVGQKGSVWYSQKELTDVDALLREKLKNDPDFITGLTRTLDTNWKVLLPYLSDKKKLKSVEEFKEYYDRLVDWWSAMTTAFTVPDIEDVDQKVRKIFLTYRIEAEKYTEKMNKVLVAFWKEHFPKFTDLTFFIAPSEVENFSKLVAEIEQRKNGCVLLDGTIYPLDRLDSLLKENGLILEEISVDGTEDIKGTPAYPGQARGQVKKISSFADMSSFKAGEILVTEMTNPDYVPIMKIAAAVVTDEGGATCHAAIASRELKIPCIVGTKIATQVLKDGDMIEVDAQKGVVKILTPELPDLANYQRLFQFDSFVSFSFSYDFVRGYLDLGGLAFSNKNIWLSYMPKSAIEKTVQEGLRLYKSKQKYEDYKKDLYQTFKDIERVIEDFEENTNVERNKVLDFFSLFKKYRVLYQKTEFFYTDLAFEKKDEFPEIAENFRSFEQFKLDGRDYLNRIFLIPNSLFSCFLKKLSTQFTVSYEDLLGYSIEDFLGLFESVKVDSQIISERQKGYLVYVADKKIVHIAGDEALNFIEGALSHKTHSNTLFGKIANKGKVTAKAKVIKISLSDYGNLSKIIDEMEQGQVLVAETTEPSIIAACKKASAIITNQGGMMSHAAIVAREMDIPCIVGVTDATEAIQDGDMIEVDADKGMVKILK